MHAFTKGETDLDYNASVTLYTGVKIRASVTNLAVSFYNIPEISVYFSNTKYQFH